MNDAVKHHEAYFIHISQGKTPDFISELSGSQIEAVRDFVEHLTSREDEDLRKMFESLAMMMKYVPNFILHNLVPKYFAPSIAAKISSHLSIKQILGVTSGLPAEYVGDTAIYLDSRLAAEVLTGLKKKMGREVVTYTVSQHPIKALEILQHTPDHIHEIASQHFNFEALENVHMDENHNRLYNQLKSIAQK